MAVLLLPSGTHTLLASLASVFSHIQLLLCHACVCASPRILCNPGDNRSGKERICGAAEITNRFVFSKLIYG